MEPMENMQTPSAKSNGPIVGIIVVIIVLAIGAYYLYAELQSQKMLREQNEVTQEAQMTDEEAVTNIEGDLQAEDLSNIEAELDADLQQLDAELQAQ